MAEVILTESKTEFTQYEKLAQLSNNELRKIVERGINIHIHMSEAATAKRVLESRRHEEQIHSIESIKEEVARMIKEGNDHWFTKRPFWQIVVIFFVTAGIFGFLVNMTAAYVAHRIGW